MCIFHVAVSLILSSLDPIVEYLVLHLHDPSYILMGSSGLFATMYDIHELRGHVHTLIYTTISLTGR